MTTATPPSTTPTTCVAKVLSSPLPIPQQQVQALLAAFTDGQVVALSKGVAPANTYKTTKWALSNFEACKVARNKKYLDDQVPDNFLKSNSEYYPPQTLYLYCVEF